MIMDVKQFLYKNVSALNYFLLFASFLISSCYAHEPWLLTDEQLLAYARMPAPELFSQLGFFNVFIASLLLLGLSGWITFNYFFPEKKVQLSKKKLSLAALSIRLGIGTSLIMLAVGLLPQFGVPHLTESNLFASEFSLFNQADWRWIKWLEILSGSALLLGIWTRFFSLMLFALLLYSFKLFGLGLLQYTGFYLASIIFLLIQGGGLYALSKTRANQHQIISIVCLQILVGINFIYSAISIKFLHPNIDIGMLTTHKAFTFGIPYDYFTFLMFSVEFLFGILFILGYRMRLIAPLMMILFIFLSIDLSENIFAHNFIFGILIALTITQGIPLLNKKLFQRR